MRKKDLARKRTSSRRRHRAATVLGFFKAAPTSSMAFPGSLVALMKGCFSKIHGMFAVGRTKRAISRSRKREELRAYSISCFTQSDLAESGESSTIIAADVSKPLPYFKPQFSPGPISAIEFQTSIPAFGKSCRSLSAHLSSDFE